jgi:hypothetical protein
MPEKTYREALREAMNEEMERDDNVVLLGEDIGVYGVSLTSSAPGGSSTHLSPRMVSRVRPSAWR